MDLILSKIGICLAAEDGGPGTAGGESVHAAFNYAWHQICVPKGITDTEKVSERGGERGGVRDRVRERESE